MPTYDVGSKGDIFTKRPSKKIRGAIKFNKGDFNTNNANKEISRNYGSLLYKSKKLELFLNSTFNINSDINSLITFILKNNLFDLLSALPNQINKEFSSVNLDLFLENKYDSEKWILITINTNLDGKSASDALDLVEESIPKEYENKFFKYILLSVEFE